MDEKKFEKAFKGQISKFLARVQINHIVCLNPHDDKGIETKLGYWQEYLKDPYHKIPIKNLFLLNDHKNRKVMTQENENDAIIIAMQSCVDSIRRIINEYCAQGQNLYHCNNVIRSIFPIIDKEISKMNYKVWWDWTFQVKKDDIFYVLFENKKISFEKLQVDIGTFCFYNILEPQFILRSLFLQQLKYEIVDIYSQYLILPQKGSNPKFFYSCTKTDLCELLYSLSLASNIDNFESLKAILLDMLRITSEEYNNACFQVRKRKRMKSIYVKSLSNALERL